MKLSGNLQGSSVRAEDILTPFQCGLSSRLGPLLVVDYITAPNVQGYQNGTIILGTAHMRSVRA